MLQKIIAAMLALNLVMPAFAIAPAESEDSGDSLTIYNQNFAVIRQRVPLHLESGINAVHFSQTTGLLEPDSVILRDPANGRKLQVVEQSYRNDPLSEAMLLSMFEGKTLDFEAGNGEDGKPRIVQGRVVRSGYMPHQPGNYSMQPIIEVNGKLQFSLPGRPLFPSLGDDSILQPTLNWALRTDKPGDFNAELSYISGGLKWEADYNLVAPEKGNSVDLVGWVTFDNQSGKTFHNAQIKLLAGDVNKLQAPQPRSVYYEAKAMGGPMDAIAPTVLEKAFDEFHMYTLQNAVTLRDHESKQVEFVHAMNVHSQKVFVYDGAQLGQYYGWSEDMARQNPEYGTQSNGKVWIMQEFKNEEANGLGIPLPKGRLRFYRRDSEGRLQFTGENVITHTPKDETVRVYTGNSFDLVGERKRIDFHVDSSAKTADETFEIKLRNHKPEAAEVRVVEHLYRWTNWRITQSNSLFNKTDAQTAEFRVSIAPNGERIVRYNVHYSW